MSVKVKIFTSYPIGERCKKWAKGNMPEGFKLTSKVADINVSVLYNKLFTIDDKKYFNFHCGLLPEYRGVGIFTWVILNGEKEFGITLHEIDEGIDTGDIIKIEKMSISRTDTAEDLFKRAEDTLFWMFKEWFPKILKGEYSATPQSKGKTYYRKDLEKAKDLTRYKRAFTFADKEPCYYLVGGEKKYL